MAAEVLEMLTIQLEVRLMEALWPEIRHFDA